MFKTAILRDVLGAGYRPSNEDSMSTEPVAETKDAVIEIERLKQENLDTMEIHALEQDVALTERMVEANGELSEATDEITEIHAEVESYYERGGMTAQDAHHIGKRLGYINKRLGGGLDIKLPSTESFRGATADRMTLTASVEASIGEMISKAWDAVVNFFKKVINKIKSWFGDAEKKAKNNEEESKDLKDKAEKLDKEKVDAADDNEKAKKAAEDVAASAPNEGAIEDKKDVPMTDVAGVTVKSLERTRKYMQELVAVANRAITEAKDLKSYNERLAKNNEVESAKKQLFGTHDNAVYNFHDKIIKAGDGFEKTNENSYSSKLMIDGHCFYVSFKQAVFANEQDRIEVPVVSSFGINKLKEDSGDKSPTIERAVTLKNSHGPLVKIYNDNYSVNTMLTSTIVALKKEISSTDDLFSDKLVSKEDNDKFIKDAISYYTKIIVGIGSYSTGLFTAIGKLLPIQVGYTKKLGKLLNAIDSKLANI